MKKQVEPELIQEQRTEVQFIKHLMNEDDAFIVHQFIHSMNEPYKEVFSLRTFGELSFEKIGRLFGKKCRMGKDNFLQSQETNFRVYGGDEL